VRCRLAVGLAILVVPAVALAAPDAASPPYAKRLQILKALAVRYPGRVEPGTPEHRWLGEPQIMVKRRRRVRALVRLNVTRG